MKPPLLLSSLALLASAGPLCSQTAVPATPPAASAPAAPASEATKPEQEPAVKVMRALPADVDPTAVIDTSTLPRTLPADVKISYSQCHVPGKVIAITFDDGPSPQNTPRLLDMLKERNIKATFFLIGKSAATWPDIVKRIVAEGHELGNHTWTHPQLTHLKEAAVMEELQSTHDAITKAAGVAPLLYRPPYGAIGLSQKKAIHDRFNYPAILWDVDPEDWRSPKSIAKVHDQVLAQTRPGSIILCHDIHQQTVDAMPSTLDDLKAKGYQFVTVIQLLNLDSQTAKKTAEVAAAAKEAKEAQEAAAAKEAAANAPPTEETTVKPAVVPEKESKKPAAKSKK